MTRKQQARSILSQEDAEKDEMAFSYKSPGGLLAFKKTYHQED